MAGSGDNEADESVRKEFAVFREDVVRCPGREGGTTLLGVVESVGGHSDSEEEELGTEPLEKGKARVSWYKKLLNPQVEDVRELEVVDRAMLHHDIVAKSSDPLGQSGFVTSVDVLCDLRFCASGREVKGVNSRNLVPLQPLKPGGFAVYGGWLGKVEEALDHVVVRFADGSVCRVSNADPETLVPLGEDVGNEESPYFPGIRVRATSRSLVHARWLHGNPPRKFPQEGAVVGLVPGRTVMRWIASSHHEDIDAHQPSDIIEGTKLTPLSAFMHSWWQLGDYGLYDIPTQAKSGAAEDASPAAGGDSAGPGDGAALEHAAAPPGAAAGGEAARAQPAGGAAGAKVEDDTDRTVEIVETTTRVSVTWQSGEAVEGLLSKELVHVHHMGTPL
ncbi:hypothetical protein T484DRAFT_1796587 [Baffinella frigidus]|nr:hypothetical protein T484DRAFT_1796587 [Cryptophyta sp. CCMP2293]